MAFSLSPGEKIVFQGHPSWRAIVAFYVRGLAIAVIAGLIAALFGLGFLVVFILVVGVLVVTVAIGAIKRFATVYTITDRRLNIRRGVFAREVQETRLDRVQNVTSSQTAIQRLFRVGDVDFDTASRDDANRFVFGGVEGPAEIIEAVNRASTETGESEPGPETG